VVYWYRDLLISTTLKYVRNRFYKLSYCIQGTISPQSHQQNTIRTLSGKDNLKKATQRSSEPDHVQKNHHHHHHNNNNNRKSKLFIDISSCHAPETHCQATFPSENMTGFISEPLRAIHCEIYCIGKSKRGFIMVYCVI